jgi:hypothetical protein
MSKKKKKKDYYVCPMGQHMKRAENSTLKSENGYVSHTTIYEANTV